MATFGAPISYGNDAELAIFAAIEMMKKMEDFKARIKPKKRFDIRIGINTGIVMSGYLGSKTRIKTLSQKTREDNARFFESIDQVPKYAITMGIGTILESHMLLLLASGKSKAGAIKATVEGPITAQVPASAVQMHRRAILIVDEDAGSKLEGKYDQFVTVIE